MQITVHTVHRDPVSSSHWDERADQVRSALVNLPELQGDLEGSFREVPALPEKNPSPQPAHCSHAPETLYMFNAIASCISSGFYYCDKIL